jgi:hypothetical protein
MWKQPEFLSLLYVVYSQITLVSHYMWFMLYADLVWNLSLPHCKIILFVTRYIVMQVFNCYMDNKALVNVYV